MKNNKFVLDFEEEDVLVGILRLKQILPYHELFFKVNKLNPFHFSRKKDLKVEGFSGFYNFPIFETFDTVTQTKLRVIANQSYSFERKEKPIEGLFDLIEEDKFFINQNVDFILFSNENCADFSAINFPIEYFYQLEEYSLSSEDELYQIILDYDEQYNKEN